MRILITGGCGFIGSNIVERLREQSHEVWADALHVEPPHARMFATPTADNDCLNDFVRVEDNASPTLTFWQRTVHHMRRWLAEKREGRDFLSRAGRTRMLFELDARSRVGAEAAIAKCLRDIDRASCMVVIVDCSASSFKSALYRSAPRRVLRECVWQATDALIGAACGDTLIATYAHLTERPIVFESLVRGVLQRHRIALKRERLDDLPACLVASRRGATVYVDSRLPSDRRALLALHELGHFWLSHRPGSEWGLSAGVTSEEDRTLYAEQEREADDFAELWRRTFEGLMRCGALPTAEVSDRSTAVGDRDASRDASPAHAGDR